MAHPPRDEKSDGVHAVFHPGGRAVVVDLGRIPDGPRSCFEGRWAKSQRLAFSAQLLRLLRRLVVWASALALIALWLSCEPFILQSIVIDALPPEAQALPTARLSLLMNEVRQLAASGNYQHASDAVAAAAAEQYRTLRNISFGAMALLALVLALVGCLVGRPLYPSGSARPQPCRRRGQGFPDRQFDGGDFSPRSVSCCPCCSSPCGSSAWCR